MKSRVLALLLSFTLVLTASPFTFAQTNNSAPTQSSVAVQDWQKLRDIKPGKKVLVEFKSGSTIDGKVSSLAGSTLTLSNGKNTYTLEQRDIQRVYRLKGRWSRSKAARIGAVIGTLVGTIVGGEIGLRAEGRVGHIPSDEDTAPAFGGFFIGMLAGAGLGALVGGKRKGELLYEAK